MTNSKELISSKLRAELDFQNLTQQPTQQVSSAKRIGKFLIVTILHLIIK